MDFAFHCDVLPAHPHPQPLEALHSYVKRLARANGIQRLQNFKHLTAGEIQNAKRLMVGIHPPPLGQLSRAVRCTEKDLLALTVCFLTSKFGRDQRRGRFLAQGMVKHLRWCPLCLAEEGYYQLPWSFRRIPGCPQHGIHFLEVCPHCKQHILLKSSSLAFDTCPHCEGDLRQPSIRYLSDDERQHCQPYWDDVVYLLAPQEWQDDRKQNIAGAVRQRLGFLRRIKDLDTQQTAQALGIAPYVVATIENEVSTGQGENLQDYFRYADYLGLTLSDVFRHCAETGYIHRDTLLTDHLLKQAEAVVQQLKDEGVPVIQKTIGERLGHRASVLRKNSAIAALFQREASIRLNRTKDYEDDLYEQTQQVISELKLQRQSICRAKICDLVGHSTRQIHSFYPRVDKLINDAVSEYRDNQPQREAALVRDVKDALAVFRKHSELITQERIAQYLGYSRTKLSSRPAIRQLISEAKRQVHEEWIEDTKSRMATEMTHLMRQHSYVSREKLLQRLGMSGATWMHYPELQAMWHTLRDMQREKME